MRKTMTLAAALLLSGCLGSDPGHGGGGSGANGGTGGGSGNGIPQEPMGCGKQTFPIMASKVSPNIMMAVDESGSMKEQIAGSNQSKWTALDGAVNDLLGKYSGAAQWGLSIFPHSPSNACGAGQLDVPVGPNTTATILAKMNALNDNNIGGNTPTNQTLQAMLGSAAGLADATHTNYVLLMTDGQPNCGGDAKAVATTVAQLYAQTPSVRTFVVGIGDGASSDPGALNSWADAGHTARTGATHYYQVNTVNDLAAAFADILNGVASCTYQLTSKPADASLIIAYIGGVAVPQDPTNGTSYDPGSNSLIFHGTSCDQIKSGAASSLDIVYGCPAGPIQ
ncbi:MAG: putative secreted protein [bacterium]|nr:putative secreted protein [bacterium]